MFWAQRNVTMPTQLLVITMRSYSCGLNSLPLVVLPSKHYLFLFICPMRLAISLLVYYQEKEKGIHHSEFILCFLPVKGEKMHDLEFFFVSFRKKKCISLSLFFVFFRKKGKGTLVSEFCMCHWKEKGNMPSQLIFLFLVSQRTMKSAKIHFWFFS